jgi:hypothetical protein
MRKLRALDMAKVQVLTAIDLRSGATVGRPIKVRTPELWIRSDTELKAAFKVAGRRANPSPNYAEIRRTGELIGWENVGFTREWAV